MRKVMLMIMLIVLTIYSSLVYATDRVSLGFIYSIGNQTDLVERTNGSINQVSPVWFNITSNGNLTLNGISKEFIANMKEQGVKVTPFLSNHWSYSKGIKALKNADKLSTQIVEAIEKYELDGVNVDIENLKSNDRDALTNFVKILREKLPEDKMLTVSVAANPYGVETGWQGSYDYKNLGEYADYLFVMTYDESSEGSNSGPVASLPFAENSIKYALENVSKDKIVMGIPLYGRCWSDNGDFDGEAVVIGDIPRIISRNSGRVWYDEFYRSPVTMFTVKEGTQISRINGEELKPGKYTIWYENEESIKEKLALVNEYDILGAGVWALGQEKVDVWDYYYSALNAIPYKDEETIQIEKEYASFINAKNNMISLRLTGNVKINVTRHIEQKKENIPPHIEVKEFELAQVPVIEKIVIQKEKMKRKQENSEEQEKNLRLKII